MLLVEASAIMSAATFGLAAGVRLPLAVAGPAALLTPFVLTAIVPAMDPPWLRHLTSTFRDCCWLQQQFAPGAAAASVIVSAMVILLSALALSVDLAMRSRMPAGIGTAAIGLALSASIVSGFGYAPVEPRDARLLTCRDAREISLCTWPEHRMDADRLAAIVADVHERWRESGVDVPAMFTEVDQSVAPPGSVAVRFGRVESRDQVVMTMSLAILPKAPTCEGGATGTVASDYLAAWYALSAGMTRAELVNQYSYENSPYPPVLDVVDTLAASSVDERRDWISRATAVNQLCTDWPAELLIP
jgi:hypothetical protein